ncbi:hypothetical protein KR215_008610 [Drosophila sulfurigaster]|nr:hypothetical protein KR215_008610 [Drosophila sulfurigaster]
MSLQSAHDGIFNFICKVTPTGQMCRNHLKAKYPECFKSNKGYVRLALETPLRIWNRFFPAKAVPNMDPSVCPICEDEDNESAFILNGFKILFLLAAAVAILYAFLKVVCCRRQSAQ